MYLISNNAEVEMADQDMAAIVAMESSMEEEKEVVGKIYNIRDRNHIFMQPETIPYFLFFRL